MRARVLALSAWVACLAIAAWLAATARYTADLSAFLPASPTAAQALLVDQLREGPVARTIIMAISGADARTRAALSRALAASLRNDARFRAIANGDSSTAAADREFVYRHRYLLSAQVTRERYSGGGLAEALAEGVDTLGSSLGLLARDLFARDPTGETLAVLGQYDRATRPSIAEGVFASRDGRRALLVADLAASGSDTDAQQAAIAAIHAAFAAARASHPAGATASLRLSGPAVFAVESRALIEREAKRFSVISSVLIALLLLAVYRSPLALLLGLLPVLSGALAGVAAVAAGFGVVHGLTLGFGVTLIGESVDYSIYLLVQGQEAGGRRDHATWLRRFWPTVRLGMLASVVGFASLLPSSFPGLEQLGLYSIAGLVCAAAMTRFVLPHLVPARLPMADVAPIGARFMALAAHARRWRGWLWLVPVLALAGIVLPGRPLWSSELAALSPVSREAQQFDSALRADLGAPDVRTLVVVTAPSAEGALAGAESASAALAPLVAAGKLAGVDSPARYLPSLRTQRERQAALPEAAALRRQLESAVRGLPVRAAALSGFVDDVQEARQGPLLVRADLAGTSLAAPVEAMLVSRGGSWNALLPLEAPRTGAGAGTVDLDAVDAALAPLRRAGTTAIALDLKRESDSLYRGYLRGAIRLSLAGLAAIVALLALTLRGTAPVVRVMTPLVLAVACVLGAHALAGSPMNLLHLVGLLLVVAVGSNYALFFHARGADGAAPARARTVASLLVANLCTVAGFGVLAFSGVPVLSAIGATVAPGTFLALVFSAMLVGPGDHAAG